MRVPIKAIILTYKRLGNIAQTARFLNISRPTVYRWILRGTSVRGYLKWKGVQRKATTPKTRQVLLTTTERERIVSLKYQKHYGARKIQRVLKLSVSPLTVHRFLKRKHLVAKQINFRRPRFQNGFAMRPTNTNTLGYLQMDTKHVTPELSGLPTTVYEYAAIDIMSRYKVAVILPDITDESAALALAFFLKWFPFPLRYIQTDNGLEFQRSFDEACQRHGITHYFIHKNSPNENAVIERSFRTDQDEFYYWLEQPPQHMGELNTWLQTFIREYNTFRPHQGLDYQTPIEVVQKFLHVT